ncbi:hypothetical protein OK016_27220 [Vibrio chagasii]|nr:hypothetical protein [Vibrio chagasii]
MRSGTCVYTIGCVSYAFSEDKQGRSMSYGWSQLWCLARGHIVNGSIDTNRFALLLFDCGKVTRGSLATVASISLGSPPSGR